MTSLVVRRPGTARARPTEARMLLESISVVFIGARE